jgi:hypothetical protein
MRRIFSMVLSVLPQRGRELYDAQQLSSGGAGGGMQAGPDKAG